MVGILAAVLVTTLPNLEPAPAPVVEHSARLLEPDAPAGNIGWRIAGAWALGAHGAALGLAGLPIAVYQAGGRGNLITVTAWAGLALGAVMGGYAGVALGSYAAQGHLWAKILLVAMDALAVPFGLVGVVTYAAGTNNFPGSG